MTEQVTILRKLTVADYVKASAEEADRIRAWLVDEWHLEVSRVEERERILDGEKIRELAVHYGGYGNNQIRVVRDEAMDTFPWPSHLRLTAG